MLTNATFAVFDEYIKNSHLKNIFYFNIYNLFYIFIYVMAVSHDPSEIILICWFGAQEMYYFLLISTLWTDVLLCVNCGQGQKNIIF